MKSKIGYNIDWKPEVVCKDKKCPYHSDVSVRGNVFEGEVKSSLMKNTVKVERTKLVRVAKYNRYLKKTSIIRVHNPECIKAQVGDKVLIGETRPLSKTKHFAVLKVLSKSEENEGN